MSTDKYGFNEALGALWYVDCQTRIESLENYLCSLIYGTLGEAINAFDPVCYDSNGHFILCSADGNPCMGLATTGAVGGEAMIVQHEGPVENPGWSWTPGSPIYVTVAGALSHTPPGSNKQIIGYAETATKIFLEGNTRVK